MATKGFIFDLDGVIVFTDRFHYQAWKQMADRIGIYFDETINNRLRGVSRMESLEIILERYEGKPLSAEEKEQLAEEKNETYRRLLNSMMPGDVSDEVRATLAALKDAGYLLAIGSSSKNAKFILERVALTGAFDAISDGTNITRSKPDPEVFLKAAEFLGLQAAECGVIEDAYAGIDAAKVANMTAIAIGDATSYEKADFRLSTFADLQKVAEELRTQ
ncbi:MAG: beta-phosphoglucomutase [Roseburia sp.]